MDPATTFDGANRYVDAVCTEDCAVVAAIFADDVARHQPGPQRAVAMVGQLSG